MHFYEDEKDKIDTARDIMLIAGLLFGGRIVGPAMAQMEGPIENEGQFILWFFTTAITGYLSAVAGGLSAKFYYLAKDEVYYQLDKFKQKQDKREEVGFKKCVSNEESIKSSRNESYLSRVRTETNECVLKMNGNRIKQSKIGH
jgi:hypothetical protein